MSLSLQIALLVLLAFLAANLPKDSRILQDPFWV